MEGLQPSVELLQTSTVGDIQCNYTYIFLVLELPEDPVAMSQRQATQTVFS